MGLRAKTTRMAPGRDLVDGVDDRADEHPQLHEEGDDVLHVAVEHVERAQPEADGERRGDRQEDEQRQEHDLPSGSDAVGGHEDEQDHEGDDEIDEPGRERPRWGSPGGESRPW